MRFWFGLLFSLFVLLVFLDMFWNSVLFLASGVAGWIASLAALMVLDFRQHPW